MFMLGYGAGVITLLVFGVFYCLRVEKDHEGELEDEKHHQRMLLLQRARRNGVRYEIVIAQAPHLGGWRWTIWDADAALLPVPAPERGVVLPYAAGAAATKADAEAHALAEIEGLRLQERVDEVFVV